MRRNDMHGDVVDHVLVQLQRVFGLDIHIQKQQSGLFTRGDTNIRINFPGIADIGGYLKGGRGFQIEVKTGDADLNREQVLWRKRCLAIGLPHWVMYVRSAEDADLETLKVCIWIEGFINGDISNRQAFKARRGHVDPRSNGNIGGPGRRAA